MQNNKMRSVNIYNGDIWDLIDHYFVAVPTNSVVNRSGCAVMGRGIAKQASLKFDNIAFKYGKRLSNKECLDNGFTVFNKSRLVMCPVKKHYKDDADIAIIERSLQLMIAISNELDINIAVPMLGCGFGGLTYEQVLPLMLKYIRDAGRFVIVIPPRQLYAKDEYYESFLPGVTNKKDRRVSMSGLFRDLEI